MKRKPMSPEAKAAATARLNEAMRLACERMERAKVLVGVIAQLNEQPREA